MRRLNRDALLAWISLLVVGTGGTSLAAEERPLADYVGAFRLETGELVHGGPFLERIGAEEPQFLFIDTEGLELGALFERERELLLRSVQPAGAISLELILGEDGAISGLVWTDSRGPIRGQRVRPHRERAFDVRADDGVSLRGRLLVPDCPAPRPAVVLISGSGPTTRWAGTFETFFLNLGMAVVVYDKRGAGDEDWTEPDFSVLAADAVAVTRAARAAPETDPSRVGMWASSQGGWVAPIAASRLARDAPAFLIVRVGPGVSEREAILHELRQEARAEGLSGIELDHASALRRELYRLAEAGRPLSDTDEVVAPFREKAWYVTAFGEDPVSSVWSESWWRRAQGNLSVEPGPYLRELDLPILWFLAEEDQNVPLVPSQLALQRAFAASPGLDETLVVVPDSDHSMLRRRPDGGFRYAEGVWSRMRTWLEARGFSDEGCHADGEVGGDS